MEGYVILNVRRTLLLLNRFFMRARRDSSSHRPLSRHFSASTLNNFKEKSWISLTDWSLSLSSSLTAFCCFFLCCIQRVCWLTPCWAFFKSFPIAILVLCKILYRTERFYISAFDKTKSCNLFYLTTVLYCNKIIFLVITFVEYCTSCVSS